MTLSPNVWNVGDTAYCSTGNQTARVTIHSFPGHLVKVTYPDDTQGLRPHSALRREA